MSSSLFEDLEAIVAEDLARREGRCVGCRVLMVRPRRRHGDLPLWYCPACIGRTGTRRERQTSRAPAA